jgi:hypothetical protein
MSVSENLIRYITIHWYVWAIIGIYFGLWMAQKENIAGIRVEGGAP